MQDVARRIEAQEKDLRRYELLEGVLKFLREYGGDIQPVVRFSASSVNFHDQAAVVVRDLIFGDWHEAGRRRTEEAVDQEMKQIEARLS